MSDQEQKPESKQEPNEGSPSRGPSLVLIYSLIAFAMIAATIIAGLIVLPFYRRR